METARSTGIILDSVYTAKAARGMVEELNKNPARFKGNKILFIHTGTKPINLPIASAFVIQSFPESIENTLKIWMTSLDYLAMNRFVFVDLY